MGLKDTIQSLETRFWSDNGNQKDGHELAKAIAEMISRKRSKRLIHTYLNDLIDVLNELGRYPELINAAGGVDPAYLGVWDCQAAVAKWLSSQPCKEVTIDQNQT